jgi:hypothetical protein
VPPGCHRRNAAEVAIRNFKTCFPSILAGVAVPLAPMGCEVQVHEKTDSRGTWAYHCVNGWYLYTLPEHYRTHVCHIKETKSDHLSDTVHFKHKHITNPEVTHSYCISRQHTQMQTITCKQESRRDSRAPTINEQKPQLCEE